jgi:phage terminase Nu1 subunit (DNA packaging protein)
LGNHLLNTPSEGQRGGCNDLKKESKGNALTNKEKRSEIEFEGESNPQAQPLSATKKNKWLQITDDGKILLSTSKLAEIMAVSVVTVHSWDRQGCPKEKRGWWDLKEVLIWRGRAVGIQGGADAQADKLSADIRLKNARATLAEQELLVKSGELISMVLVEERLTELFGNLKTSIMGIADNVMTELYSQYPELAPQVRRLIDGYIRKALRQIADNGGVLRAGCPAKKAVGRPRKTAKKSLPKP